MSGNSPEQSPFEWFTHTWYNLMIKIPSYLPCWFSLKSEKERIWILLNWNWCCSRIYNGILCFDKLSAFSFQRLNEKLRILYMAQLRQAVSRRNDKLSRWSLLEAYGVWQCRAVGQIITIMDQALQTNRQGKPAHTNVHWLQLHGLYFEETWHNKIKWS